MYDETTKAVVVMSKAMANLSEQYEFVREELSKKKQRIKELEDSNQEIRDHADKYYQEKVEIVKANSKNEKVLQDKIAELGKENAQLKEQLQVALTRAPVI